MEPDGPAGVITRRTDEGSQEGVGQIHPEGRTHCRQVRYAETSYSWEDKTEEETVHLYDTYLSRYDVRYDWQSEDYVTELVFVTQHWYQKIYTTYSRQLSHVYSWTENTCDPGVKFNERIDTTPGEWEETGKSDYVYWEEEETGRAEAYRNPSVWKRNQEERNNPENLLSSTILDYDELLNHESPLKEPEKGTGQTGVEERIFGYSTSNEPGTIFLTQGAGLNTRKQALWKGAIGMQISREAIQGAQRVNGYVSPVQWDTGVITDVEFNPQVTSQQHDDVHHVSVTVTYGWYRLLITTASSSE